MTEQPTEEIAETLHRAEKDDRFRIGLDGDSEYIVRFEGRTHIDSRDEGTYGGFRVELYIDREANDEPDDELPIIEGEIGVIGKTGGEYSRPGLFVHYPPDADSDWSVATVKITHIEQANTNEVTNQ